MGYLGAKLISLAILTHANFYVAVGWCSVEALGLLAMRYFAEGTWRHHIKGLSGVVPSLMVHVVVYMGMLATPFPFLRFPGWAGPSVWASCIAYSLAINPVMAYVGFTLGADRIIAVKLATVQILLVLATAISVTGMAMMGLAMEPSRRHTFYKHFSMRSLLDELWDTRELTHMVDGSCTAGTDASRADLITLTSDYWVSIDRLRTWLTKWDEWEIEQPSWFTDPDIDFQARVVNHVPEEALPPTVLRKILSESQVLSRTSAAEREYGTELDTATLVLMVKELRQELKARKQKRRRKMAMAATKAYALAIAISYTDLLGDVAVSLSLYQGKTTRNESYVVIGITVFSQVIQAIASFACGHGLVATFVALAGLKPLLNEYNALSDRPLTRGTAIDHDNAKTETRLMLVLFQSLPQGFYQCLVLLQMVGRDETPTWVQWASVVGAAISVGFVVADTDRGVDTSARRRLDAPSVHGYIPDKTHHALLVSLGTILFVGGMTSSKWVAIATLATTSATAAGSWLVVECAVLLVLRYAVEGSWRFLLHGPDAAVPSVLIHLGLYLGSIAAPFPLLRFPGYLGPSLYCASACYQTIASPLMLLVAFSMEGGSGMPQADLWALVGVATVVLLVGASLMGCYMVPEYRKTFYQDMSFKTLTMWMWDERTRCVLGDGPDASRAHVLGFATWSWPPSDQVRTWLENWERWEREQPAWFTDKWKAQLRHPSVPPEALPPALKHTFDTADANKERYRRATGRQSMVHAPSPAEEGAGLDPRSMPRKIRNTVFGGRLADRAEHGSSASAKIVPK